LPACLLQAASKSLYFSGSSSIWDCHKCSENIFRNPVMTKLEHYNCIRKYEKTIRIATTGLLMKGKTPDSSEILTAVALLSLWVGWDEYLGTSAWNVLFWRNNWQHKTNIVPHSHLTIVNSTCIAWWPNSFTVPIPQSVVCIVAYRHAA
jgi:hypothetical protein